MFSVFIVMVVMNLLIKSVGAFLNMTQLSSTERDACSSKKLSVNDKSLLLVLVESALLKHLICFLAVVRLIGEIRRLPVKTSWSGSPSRCVMSENNIRIGGQN